MITYHMITASMCASDTLNVNNKYITTNVTELSENISGKFSEIISLGLCFPNYILKI